MANGRHEGRWAVDSRERVADDLMVVGLTWSSFLRSFGRRAVEEDITREVPRCRPREQSEKNSRKASGTEDHNPRSTDCSGRRIRVEKMEIVVFCREMENGGWWCKRKERRLKQE
jgi:hypothetical protein